MGKPKAFSHLVKSVVDMPAAKRIKIPRFGILIAKNRRMIQAFRVGCGGISCGVSMLLSAGIMHYVILSDWTLSMTRLLASIQTVADVCLEGGFVVIFGTFVSSIDLADLDSTE